MKLSSVKSLPEEPNVHNPKITKQVFIRKGEVPYLTNLTRAKFPAGEVANAHTHQDMYEIFFIEEGNATVKINGKPIKLGPGDCITVEPGESHEVSNLSSDDVVMTYICIEVPHE